MKIDNGKRSLWVQKEIHHELKILATRRGLLMEELTNSILHQYLVKEGSFPQEGKK